jgi:NitT/TauT family transport system permease protein
MSEAAARVRASPPIAGSSTPLALRLMGSPLGMLSARLAIAAVFLLAWEFAPVEKSTRFWLSSPSAVLGALWGWIVDGSLWWHVGATLHAMTLGYLLGCALGVAIGFMFGFLPRVHLVLSPYIAALYALPKVALAPLFIVLLGIDIASKVALVAVTVFFIVLSSTLDGVRNVDRDLIRSLALMGATRRETIVKVFFPATLTWIFTGMRISVRYAFTGTLLAELIGANRGLGYLIEYNSGLFNTTGAYAAVVVIVILSVALTEALTRIERSMARIRG